MIFCPPLLCRRKMGRWTGILRKQRRESKLQQPSMTSSKETRTHWCVNCLCVCGCACVWVCVNNLEHCTGQKKQMRTGIWSWTVLLCFNKPMGITQKHTSRHVHTRTHSCVQYMIHKYTLWPSASWARRRGKSLGTPWASVYTHTHQTHTHTHTHTPNTRTLWIFAALLHCTRICLKVCLLIYY